MNTPHIGITCTQRSVLRRHRHIQRQARYVAPMKCRHDDAEPTWPEYLVMLAFSLALMWGVWKFAAWVLPMIWGLS